MYECDLHHVIVELYHIPVDAFLCGVIQRLCQTRNERSQGCIKSAR
ncbi:hypothetical protein CI1B_24060 [Bradyrhizobium ivorense]|uniref:Uncharacterized protein n=1 Tax=Bradyrhizobium ivorense TaxID=2511166 RepID=A0A508T0N3_9BRAD|nr:hypothetical protein CI1B_24060 [Bradyrhizobium ivorense]